MGKLLIGFVIAVALVSTGPCAYAYTETQISTDLDYLISTATPGDTMRRQGVETSLSRLVPEFRHRLALAIKAGRDAGLSGVGVFSAYRPPVYGVGGFKDKFDSMHAYGLAVDMTGIGAAGSKQAVQWHQIARSFGVIGPYGAYNRAEWNHMQPCLARKSNGTLRGTISASGPLVLEAMFKAAGHLINSIAAIVTAPTILRTAYHHQHKHRKHA